MGGGFRMTLDLALIGRRHPKPESLEVKSRN